MDRSEKLIECGDSWFSPICIEVQPCEFSYGGRALDGCGGLGSYQIQPNFEYHNCIAGVRLRVRRSVVVRETAQTVS